MTDRLARSFFLAALLPSLAWAAGETVPVWGLSAGPEPRTLCVFDTSASRPCVPVGALNSTTHVYTGQGNSILTYGAIPNDASKGAVNAAAIAAALATGNPVYCPSGQTFYSAQINVPVNGSALYGGCTIIAAGTITSGLLVVFNNVANFTVNGITWTSSRVTYTGKPAMYVQSSNNVRVEDNVITDAGYGIYCQVACHDMTIVGNRIDNYEVRGIEVRSSDAPMISGNRVIEATAGGSHKISVFASNDAVVAGNYTKQGVANPTCVPACGFGVSISGGSSRFVVSSNVIMDGEVEGINVTSNGADVTGGIINANFIYDSVGNSHDYGISTESLGAFEVRHIQITNNEIIAPFKSGIVVANGGTNFTITGNYIYNSLGGAPGNPWGIQIPANSTTVVTGNTIIDSAGVLTYAICDYAPSLGLHQNWIGQNYGFGQSVSFICPPPTLVGSAATDLKSLAYTSTITALAGTFTSVSGASSNYERKLDYVFYQLTVTVTTNGTASGGVVATLPIANGPGQSTCSGRNVTSGKQIQGIITAGATTVQVFNYDNTYPGADATTLRLSCVYFPA